MQPTEFKSKMLELGWRLKANMEKILEPIVQTEGLTWLQALILTGIQKKEIDNVGSICKFTGLGQANASTICKKLEKEGFLCRERDKTDERVVSITLTEKGRRALVNIGNGYNLVDVFLSSVSPGKLETIINGFEELDKIMRLFTEQKNKQEENII